MDIINRIVLESSPSQNVSLQIEMENLQLNSVAYDYKKCNIIMISLCSSFVKIYDSIASSRNISMHHDSPLVIVLMEYHETHKIAEIFNILWHANVYNVNVLKNDMTVVTYFPFQLHLCTDTSPVVINRFVNGNFINSTADFFPNKMKDLQGCKINVSTANNAQPYIFVEKLENGSYSLHGRDITLLNTLADALNFKTHFVYIGKEGVLYENGTAEGALETLIDGTSDLAIADLWLKENRLKYVDATTSYIIQTIAFVIPPGAEFTSFEKYAKPLDMYTWILLLTTIGIAFIVIYYVKRMSQHIQEFIFGKGVSDPYMNVLAAVVGGAQPIEPKRNFSRYLLMLFLLFCLVMRTIYQGSLYRFLQSTIRHKEVQSIDEMIERDYKFYVVPSILDLIQGQQRIYERSVLMTLEERELLFNKSHDAAFKGVFLRSLSGVLYSNQKTYNTSIFLICKEKFMTFSVVIYMRKGFYLLEQLNEKIQQLQTAGLIDYWHSEIFDERYLNIKESEQPKRIKIEHLSGGFIIFFIGCFIASCAFIFEISYNKISKSS